jgi:hypothetical protein
MTDSTTCEHENPAKLPTDAWDYEIDLTGLAETEAHILGPDDFYDGNFQWIAKLVFDYESLDTREVPG